MESGPSCLGGGLASASRLAWAAPLSAAPERTPAPELHDGHDWSLHDVAWAPQAMVRFCGSSDRFSEPRVHYTLRWLSRTAHAARGARCASGHERPAASRELSCSGGLFGLSWADACAFFRLLQTAFPLATPSAPDDPLLPALATEAPPAAASRAVARSSSLQAGSAKPLPVPRWVAQQATDAVLADVAAQLGSTALSTDAAAWALATTAAREGASAHRSAISSSSYAYAAPDVQLCQLSLKLPHAAATALPATGLRRAVAAAISASSAPSHQPLLALEATARPGCTLLTAYAVSAAGGAPGAGADVAGGAGAAAASLRAALAEPGPAGAFLRSARDVALRHAGGAASAHASHGAVSDGDGGSSFIAAAGPALPPLSPLAALAGGDVALTWHGDAVPAGAQLRCALHGQLLRFSDGATSAPLLSPGAPRLRAAKAEGAALLSADDGPSRVLLLTWDKAIVEEVARTAESLRVSYDGDARGRVESALLALGHALRPGCSRALAAHAAALALRLGWHAAATRALRTAAAAVSPREEAASAASSLLLPAGVSLLHVAASLGSADAVTLVSTAGGHRRLFGAAGSVCGTPAAATPLHAAVAAALAQPGQEASAKACSVVAQLLHTPDGVAAWEGARCARGLTPAAMAAPLCAPGGPLAAADSATRQRAAQGAVAMHAARRVLAASFGVCAPAEQAAFGPALLHAARAAFLARHSEDAIDVADAMLRSAAAIFGADVAVDLAPLLAHDGSAPAALGGEGVCLSYDEFVRLRFRFVLRMSLLYYAVFYAAQHLLVRRRHVIADLGTFVAERGTWTVGTDTLHLVGWHDGVLPVYRALHSTWQSAALQAPALLLLLLQVAPVTRPGRRWDALRAWQLRWALPVVVLQHVAHATGSALLRSALLARALPGVHVVWPLKFAWLCSATTLIMQGSFPLPLRVAYPMLALRAALPLAAALGGAYCEHCWAHTPPAGVAMQLFTVALTAALLRARDALLRPAYHAHLALQVAAAAELADTKKRAKME